MGESHGSHTICTLFINHSFIHSQISILRSAQSDSRTFRSVLKEVTYQLGYEATASLNTQDIQVSVAPGKDMKEEQMKQCIGHKIADKIALIPILRSGLAMTDGMLDLIPKASVHHIGMYHIPGARPVQYFSRLPRKCSSDVAFVVDPVIASAETILAVVAILKKVRRKQ
jgi:uracil phosphoribosyltransferase